jgi:pimeloyl-ACP methyl ester carboxylesterase
MSAPATPTVLLVHGAWHGAWCWTQVVEGLAERGIAGVAIDLPGHGVDPHPLTDLIGHGDAVRAAVAGIDGDVVLCGHSYGGAAITDGGTAENVRHLVYISAFPLDLGESMIEHDVPGGEENELRAAMQIEGEHVTIAPAGAVPAFFHDCDPDAAAGAAKQLGPELLAGFAQHPRHVAWRDHLSTYAICTDDRAVAAPLQRNFAGRCTNQVDWDTSHSPFLSRPDLVVDLLTEIVGTLEP